MADGWSVRARIENGSHSCQRAGMSAIQTAADLEARLGVAGLPVKMKVIDHIDDGAAAWIAASPLAFVSRTVMGRWRRLRRAARPDLRGRRDRRG